MNDTPLIVLGLAAITVGVAFSFYGGWALVALRGRDDDGDQRPGFVWAVLGVLGSLSIAYGINQIEGHSTFSFGLWRWCIFVIAASAIGAFVCWLDLRRRGFDP